MTSIFPALPGIKAKRKKGAEFSTLVHRSASGRRSSMGRRFFPVWHFSLSYEFLRAKPSAQELQLLQGFFMARRGALEPFYYRDRDCCSVTHQAVGISTAANGLTFPLVYTIGQGLDRVGAVDMTGAAPVAMVDGVPVAAAWQRNKLVLNAPAPVGSVVSWSGKFFYNVAFKDDRMDFEQFLYQLHSADGVLLETVNWHD